MTTQTLPKSEWGPGPWQDEPDLARWIDKPTGLRCAIVRSDVTGALCGYVEIDHPSLCRPAEDLRFQVEGRFDFSGFLFEDETGWWLGFHCDRLMDVTPALDALTRRRNFGSTPPSVLSQLLSALGQDGLFRQTYKDIGFVRSQCAYLAGQVARASRLARGMRE